MIAFTVYGHPQPQGSKKGFPVKTKSGKVRAVVVDDNKESLVDWRTNVAAVVQEHRPAEGLYSGAVAVTLRFYFVRPKSVSPKKRPFPSVKPDVDKLTRAIFDALKGRVYGDDAQVVEMHASKHYDAVPRVEVEVEEV